MHASSKVYWLSHVSVDDLAVGSSPQNMTTPPLGPDPIELACFMTSPERSSPGHLPYHAPATPSTSAYSTVAPIWLPHTVAAASSSLSPGRCTIRCAVRSSSSCSNVRSNPPSGDPG